MIDWIEELLARFGDDEREEDGLLPDWRLELSAPVPPPEQGADGEAEKGGRAGPEDGADTGSAETVVWDAPEGTAGLGRTEDGLKRRKKPESNGENGYSLMPNGGLWPDGTADGMPGPGRQADGEPEPGAVMDGLARALGGPAQALSGVSGRGGAEGCAGAAWTDGTVEIPAGWTAVGFEGAKAFVELDKAVRAEAAGGVEWLYRQTAAVECTAAPGQTIRTVRQAESEAGPAALTLEELDRAVRRDSRRYDGEMSIF